MTDDGRIPDPTRIREQRSLTQSTGTIWIVVGGLLAGIAGVILALLTSLDLTLALVGLAIVLALYVAMVAIRVLVPEGRRRLGLLAACMLGIALVSLVIIGTIAATQWDALGT